MANWTNHTLTGLIGPEIKMQNHTAKVHIPSHTHHFPFTHIHHTPTDCYKKLQKTIEVLSVLPKGGAKASKKRKAVRGTVVVVMVVLVMVVIVVVVAMVVTLVVIGDMVMIMIMVMIDQSHRRTKEKGQSQNERTW